MGKRRKSGSKTSLSIGLEGASSKRQRKESQPAKIVNSDKKKKKKPSRKSKEEDPVLNVEVDDAPVYEGSMLGGQMILIDRVNKKVYSGLETLDSGERKLIGFVDDSGEVQLDPVVSNEPARTSKKETKSKECADKHELKSVDKKTSIPSEVATFPFETDADDHCESPCEAYADVIPFLEACSQSLGKDKSDLAVYDPYFCNGAVIENLASLGFPNVYNRKEDCYQVWKNPSRLPPHDVLVTNPPYSGDHIEKLIEHITSPSFGNRPWMLLLPQWVHKKDYYLKLTSKIRPFYVVPKKRYVYLPPPSFRETKKSDVHKKSSPFVSMWFLWGGTMGQNNRWLALSQRLGSNCQVARSKSALRDLRRKGGKKKR